MNNEDNVLTVEMIEYALKIGGRLPLPATPCIVSVGDWETYKSLFNLTEEQMRKYFIKTSYIPKFDKITREKK